MGFQLRNFWRHFGASLIVAALAAFFGWYLNAYLFGKSYWFATVWMTVNVIVFASRYEGANEAFARGIEFASPKRSSFIITRSLLFFVTSMVCSCVLLSEISWSAIAVGLWGSFIFVLAHFFDTFNRGVVFTTSSSFIVGLLLCGAPFCLGAWIGEPSFTPWLASLLMLLHPVSQALVLAGQSNLIDPVFYSATMIGVVEVELFSPFVGMFFNGVIVVLLALVSVVRDRKRDAI